MALLKIEDVQSVLQDKVDIIVDENNKAIAYEILTGKFKGIKYTYLDSKINESTGDDSVLELEFNYYVFNEADVDVIITDDFKEYIGDLYVEILNSVYAV